MGVYSDIALPLQGAEWRQVSMVMLAKAISKATSKAEHEFLSLRCTIGWHGP